MGQAIRELDRYRRAIARRLKPDGRSANIRDVRPGVFLYVDDRQGYREVAGISALGDGMLLVQTHKFRGMMSAHPFPPDAVVTVLDSDGGILPTGVGPVRISQEAPSDG